MTSNEKVQIRFKAGDFVLCEGDDECRVAAVFNQPDGSQLIVTRDNDGHYSGENIEATSLMYADQPDRCPLDPSTIDIGAVLPTAAKAANGPGKKNR